MKPRPLLVIFITIFIDLLGFGIIIPILPIHASELGAPGWVIGLVAASFSAMQFLFGPFWGGLSDRLGRRPILMGSMLLMGFSYILFAFSSFSLVILFLSRLLAGISAANISAAQAFISDITPPEKRAKNFGIIGAAFGLGFIFGPPIGGFLKADYGIDAVGYAAAGFSFFNLILAYFLLPETLVERSEKTSLFINPLEKLGSALKRVAIGDLMIISFIFMVAFSMMQVTAALFWVAEFGLTEKGVGYMFLYIGLLAAIIQGGFIGKLNIWFGERNLLISGTLLMMTGLTLMPFAPKEHFLLWELPSLAVVSLGNAFLTPTINSLLSRLSGAREQGAILGASQSFNSLARVVGPILGGWLYGMDFRIPYLASGLLVLLCTFLAVRLVKSGKLITVQV
jgi:MFS transporter, DHA1 family, tetracycline resistance protein